MLLVKREWDAAYLNRYTAITVQLTNGARWDIRKVPGLGSWTVSLTSGWREPFAVTVSSSGLAELLNSVDALEEQFD